MERLLLPYVDVVLLVPELHRQDLVHLHAEPLLLLSFASDGGKHGSLLARLDLASELVEVAVVDELQ